MDSTMDSPISGSVFALLQRVLDNNYPNLPNDDGQRDERVRNALNTMSTKYRRLIKKEANIDFTDETTRLAYMFVYGPAHICMVEHAFEKWWEAENGRDLSREFFSQDSMKVCCFGGGPGSDILGLLRFMDTKGKHPRVSVNIFDRVDLWATMWDSVLDVISNQLRSSYFERDFTDSELINTKLKNHPIIYDLFTLVKFWSEVHLSNHAARALGYFFQKAKVGSYILFIDNNDIGNEFAVGLGELLRNGGSGTWSTILRESYNRWNPPNFHDRNEYFSEYMKRFGKEGKERYPLSYPGFVLVVYRKESM